MYPFKSRGIANDCRYDIICAVKKIMSILAALALGNAFAAAGMRTATCAADIAKAVALMDTNVVFSAEATVAYHPQRTKRAIMGIVDDTGAATLTDFINRSLANVKAGDRVFVQGIITPGTNSPIPTAHCEKIQLLSHGIAPKPIDITAAEFHSGRFDHAYVRITGTVRDMFLDEIDPNWHFLVIGTEHGSVFAAFIGPEHLDLSSLEGSTIAISGLCERHLIPQQQGSRNILRRILGVSGMDSIEMIQPSPKDPFGVPELKAAEYSIPERIAVTGRRRTRGTVLATWGERNMILASEGQGDAMVCKLKSGPPPACGEFVEVAGLPETDLFRINLARTVWRKAKPTHAILPEKASCITAEQLFTDENGKPKIQTRFHGHPVTINGLVRSVPAENSPESRIYLECGKFSLPVEIGTIAAAMKSVPIGSEVSITGICVTEADNWSAHSPFPHIRDVFLVPRTTADISIIRQPPWWTAQRLLVVLAALLFAMLAILIWNLSLRRLAERRGRELAEESIARAETDMKVLERTRLAVELHDSVAQNLTGVAMELETARQFLNGPRTELRSHIDIAWRTLKSCREELRNCLWDLRSQALEEPDMETAIQRTLLPHVKGIHLAVRFKVPRSLLSDNTAHVILRIVRELTLNGIRHGGASTILVAGGIEGASLMFSVRDDGCGYDPENCPGAEDGHYGLQGIRERVRMLGGTVKVSSGRGKGTKTTISINIPEARRDEQDNGTDC